MTVPTANGPASASTIPSILRTSYGLLPVEYRRKAPLLLAVLLTEAILDVLALASAVPLIYHLSNAAAPAGSRSLPVLQSAHDALGRPDDTTFALALVGLVLVAFVVRHAFGVLSARFQQRFVYGVAIDVIQRQYRAHVGADHEATRGRNTSLLDREIAIYPMDFATGIVLPACMLISEGVVVILIGAGLTFFQPLVAPLLALVVIPPLLITRRIVKGKTHEAGIKRNYSRAQAHRTLTQAMQSIVQVRLLDKAAFFEEKMTGFFRDFAAVETRLMLLSLLPRQLIELNAVIAIAFLLVAVLLVDRNAAPVLPLLAVVLGASYRVMPSMTRLLAALVRLRSSAAILPALRPPMEAPSAPVVPPAPFPFDREVRFAGVSFRYGGTERFVIEDATFSILKGECVGLVGPSGSGKTTLINLLLRFLKEQQGCVLVDGHRLGADDDARWRRSVGYVEQDPYLLDGTLAENIAFGERPENVSLAGIERAVRSAALTPLVASLPRGLETPIGEMGALLSGGQRQRIAIARALYRNPALLILDEATSALDAVTEAEVAQTVVDLKRERRTIVIVAHRGRLIDLCDRLYQLEGGRIEAAGPTRLATGRS